MSEFILRVSRFRKLGNLELRFPASGIVLLDGPSGVGKTSILEAISFVLYDNAGNSCYPRQERSSKRKPEPTWVELTFPNGMVIYRQRRSNLLRITGIGMELIDDSAQAYIDKNLASYGDWLVGGYIRYKETCGFFTMSSDEKLDFLQRLSMSDTDSNRFEKLLLTTNQEIVSLNNQAKSLELNIQVLTELYMRIYNQCPESVRTQEVWTPEILAEYISKYNMNNVGTIDSQLKQLLQIVKVASQKKSQSLQSEISQVQGVIIQIKEQIQQRSYIQKQLDSIEDKLNSLPDFCEQIDSHRDQLRIVEEQLIVAEQSERRNQLLSAKTATELRLHSIPDERSQFTIAQLDKFDDVLSGLKPEEIKDKLTEIALAGDYCQKRTMNEQYLSVSVQIERLQQKLEQLPQKSKANEIEDINKRIWTATLLQNSLTCPKCQTCLQLNNGKLTILAEQMNVAEQADNIHELKTLRTKYLESEALFNQRVHVELQLSDQKAYLETLTLYDLGPKPKLADCNKGELDKIVYLLDEKLRAWELIPDNLKSTTEERQKIHNQQEREALVKTIGNIVAELSNIKHHEPMNVENTNLKDRKAILIKELAELEKRQMQRSNTLSNRDQLISQLCNFPERDLTSHEVKLKKMQDELANHTSELVLLEQSINAQIQLNQLTEIRNNYSQHQLAYEQVNKELAANHKIKACLVTAEYIRLDQKLSQLNRKINKILSALFQEPINITISSLRQLKSDDRIKPQINYTIIYEGAEVTKISEISGGEAMRVSLAMAIAFSRLSNMPFLLLDESLSTLDAITKESTIQMIKDKLPNKIVVVVNHDTTSGVYNSVMRLSKSANTLVINS